MEYIYALIQFFLYCMYFSELSFSNLSKPSTGIFLESSLKIGRPISPMPITMSFFNKFLHSF